MRLPDPQVIRQWHQQPLHLELPRQPQRRPYHRQQHHQVLDKGAFSFALCVIATIFAAKPHLTSSTYAHITVGTNTPFTLQSRCPLMSDVPNNSFETFAHMVDTGWITECADLSGTRPSNSSGIYHFYDSGSCDLTGFYGGAACGSDLSDDDVVDAKEFDIACGLDLSAESCDYDMSDISWKHAHFSDQQVANGPVGSNVDICVDAAFYMRPVDPSKALSLKVSTGNFTHEDIVVIKSDQFMQEERKSLLQCSLERGLVALSDFNTKTIIRMQLDCELTELGNSTLLADNFRGRAPATLLGRVRSVEKMYTNFGLGGFPPDEPLVHQFFTAERKQDATPSCLKGFLEALSFCLHVLFVDQLGQVVQSHRCQETTTADVSKMISQAYSLKVDEWQMLRTKFCTGETCDRIFSGAILFAVCSKDRWSDHMYCTEVLRDHDDIKALRFIEGHITSHETMRSEMFIYRFLPLTAPAFRVSSDCWPEQWMANRHSDGVRLTPFHTIMPASNHEGCLTQRLQLGDHAGSGTGLKMVHTYSRDASSESSAELVVVHEAIRVGRFLPDSTRSGRFVHQGMTTTDRSAKPMPSGREELRAVVDINLVDEKSGSESGQEIGTSSSDSSSQEEFPEGQKKRKLYNPPEPPEGCVLWQHSRLMTLRPAPHDFERVSCAT